MYSTALMALTMAFRLTISKLDHDYPLYTMDESGYKTKVSELFERFRLQYNLVDESSESMNQLIYQLQRCLSYNASKRP